jgi:hypothetical protein
MTRIDELREAGQRVREHACGPETEWLQLPLRDLDALLDVVGLAQEFDSLSMRSVSDREIYEVGQKLSAALLRLQEQSQ